MGTKSGGNTSNWLSWKMEHALLGGSIQYLMRKVREIKFEPYIPPLQKRVTMIITHFCSVQVMLHCSVRSSTYAICLCLCLCYAMLSNLELCPLHSNSALFFSFPFLSPETLTICVTLTEWRILAFAFTLAPSNKNKTIPRIFFEIDPLFLSCTYKRRKKKQSNEQQQRHKAPQQPLPDRPREDMYKGKDLEMRPLQEDVVGNDRDWGVL